MQIFRIGSKAPGGGGRARALDTAGHREASRSHKRQTHTHRLGRSKAGIQKMERQKDREDEQASPAAGSPAARSTVEDSSIQPPLRGEEELNLTTLEERDSCCSG
ncbi:hypothetical protein GQ55_2G007200 [Panicum hallii var. hallii]|uniref:Uncharacterized protein n=1 Tax=Panicum hallii var. hallii TaxID=1504633 RepID=A0A2T7EK57_9POAL|nr:hypothetical protein GQ55_2G007200 [Panicum hallii var. hallii]